MTELLAARSQMALSLGFHIVFAAIGIAMPFFMAAAYYIFLKHKDEHYRLLTKAWSKGVGIFFAVGAVSGTLLSFELGLLWPRFMKHAGPIIGMPFSWEGTAFFLEAIALGVFLYGWNRVQPWWHWFSGIVVGISGVASGLFVICANGWMNSPTGFDWNNGHPINIDPWAAMFNDAALLQGIHMIAAAFQAVGFAVAGLHALLWLKTKHLLHFKALKIAFVFAAVAALVQPIIGDLAAKSVAKRQPIKLAAMEGHFTTERGADLLLGGIPDETREVTDYAIRLPHLLSFLAYGQLDAEVKGLKDFSKDLWPPVLVTHLAFQVMVGLGTLMAVLGAYGLWGMWRRPEWWQSRRFLRILVFATPLGFLALEAGWVVTEVGRQPWIIYGYMRTAEALTQRPGIIYNLALYTGMYVLLTAVVSVLIIRQTQLLHRELQRESR